MSCKWRIFIVKVLVVLNENEIFGNIYNLSGFDKIYICKFYNYCNMSGYWFVDILYMCS